MLAFELGGRWSTEAATFVKLLARLRARAAPAFSRGPAISAFAFRWSALISFAAAASFLGCRQKDKKNRNLLRICLESARLSVASRDDFLCCRRC